MVAAKVVRKMEGTVEPATEDVEVHCKHRSYVPLLADRKDKLA